MTRQVPDASTGSAPFDFIVCTTKNIPDILPRLTEIIAPAVNPSRTVIVLIQNGLNIERPFHQRFPSNIVLSGISLVDASEITHGHIVQRAADRITISPFHNPSIESDAEEYAAKQFVEIYSAAAKTDCKYDGNVGYQRWRKLLFNSALNPLCAITGLDTGRLRLATGAVEGLVRPAMEEIRAAASAAGYQIPEGDTDYMINVDPIDLYLRPSMMQDLEKVCCNSFLLDFF